MTKFTQVTIVCNKEHEIVEGSCALCERDKAQHNARRYRTLREMIGVLNVEIGRIIGLKEHSFLNMTAEGMRQTLDEALDSRADKLERPEGDRNGTETHMLEQTGPTESAAPQGQLAMETTASRVAPADVAGAYRVVGEEGEK